jgi:hypothetical protein
MNNISKYHLFRTDRKVNGKIKQIVFLSGDDITSNQVQSKVKEYDNAFHLGSTGTASWKMQSIIVHSSWLRFDREITREELEILKKKNNYYSHTPDFVFCTMDWVVKWEINER